MTIIHKIAMLIMCHLIGDYVLQNDYIAQTKGTNYYHLFVHCMLYLFPFAIFFGIDYRLIALFISHFLMDKAKARDKAIPYWMDQVYHYAMLGIFIF